MPRRCTLGGHEICAEEIMGCDYTGELGGVDPEVTKLVVLVGENDEAVGPMEVLGEVARRGRGSVYVRMKSVGHLPPVHGEREF